MSEILDFEIEETPEHSEAFRILDDSGASWAIRKLSALRGKMKTNQDIFDAEVQRLKAWLETVNGKLTTDAGYFESILTDYAHRQRVEENRKTITLPHGTIKSRVSVAKVKVDNVDAFLSWAKTTDAESLIRVKEEPAVTAFKEQFEIVGEKVIHKSTGEVVAGVTVIPESLSINLEAE